MSHRITAYNACFLEGNGKRQLIQQQLRFQHLTEAPVIWIQLQQPMNAIIKRRKSKLMH